MVKFKNPELNSTLSDIEEEKTLDVEQKYQNYIRALDLKDDPDYCGSKEDYKEILEAEKWKKLQRAENMKMIDNQILYSMDADYNKPLEGKRRTIFFDDYRDAENTHYIKVYEEKSEKNIVERMTDDVYKIGASLFYRGACTDVPAHWNNEQAEKYLEMVNNGYKLSEKIFNRYIKSDTQDFDSFLNIERVKSRISKDSENTHNNEAYSPSIASIAKIRRFKKSQNEG